MSIFKHCCYRYSFENLSSKDLNQKTEHTHNIIHQKANAKCPTEFKQISGPLVQQYRDGKNQLFLLFKNDLQNETGGTTVGPTTCQPCCQASTTTIWSHEHGFSSPAFGHLEVRHLTLPILGFLKERDRSLGFGQPKPSSSRQPWEKPSEMPPPHTSSLSLGKELENSSWKPKTRANST